MEIDIQFRVEENRRGRGRPKNKLLGVIGGDIMRACRVGEDMF